MKILHFKDKNSERKNSLMLSFWVFFFSIYSPRYWHIGIHFYHVPIIGQFAYSCLRLHDTHTHVLHHLWHPRILRLADSILLLKFLHLTQQMQKYFSLLLLLLPCLVFGGIAMVFFYGNMGELLINYARTHSWFIHNKNIDRNEFWRFLRQG